MLAPKEMPDFKTPDERTAWITAHAEYFTCAYRRQHSRIRTEHNDIEEARFAAWHLCRAIKASVLIYAVLGPHDALVETVKPPT